MSDDSTAKDPLEEFKKMAGEYNNSQYNSHPHPLTGGGSCPNCGYCPHCGRGGRQFQQPYYPQPYVVWCGTTGGGWGTTGSSPNFS